MSALALAERVCEALADAVARVEAGGEPETVNVMPVVAGESIGPGFKAIDAGVSAATQGRRVRATPRVPGSGGCALVLLERLEDVDVLRAENEALRAQVDTMQAQLDQHREWLARAQARLIDAGVGS